MRAFVRELALRFAWFSKRFFVPGAATAEPAKRRVLARTRSFILNWKDDAAGGTIELLRLMA